MLRSSSLRPRFSLKAAAVTTILALTAANATQASAAIRPLAAAHAEAGRSSALRPATSITFTTLDNPGDKTFNQLLGIDANGVISGYFGSGMAHHPNIGYTIAPPYTTFVPDMMPTSTQTQATGILPGGTTTGFWAPSDKGIGLDQNYGFVRVVQNGVTLYVSVNDPLADGSPVVNQVLGIDANLTAVGFYQDKGNNPHGFLYSLKTGNFTAFNIPNAVSDAVTGISNTSNEVCGSFTDTKGHTKGFVESLTNGSNVHFEAPNSTFTNFLGVNDNGVAVGFYNDGNMVPHGIVYDYKTGALAIINDPSGAMGTTLNGINDKGEIVGFYTDSHGNTHGLIVLGVSI
jgi:hypothetical protein